MSRDNRYKILLKLSKLSCVDDGDIAETFREVTQALAEGLGVERASIWFYGPESKSIICQDLYQGASKSHSSGVELFAKDFPAYFTFLAEERTLPASDARSHPSTAEFTETYLIPNNIFSMLDAPIRTHGKTIGVICNESVGSQRTWSYTDEIFAGNVSDIISRALHAKDRIDALRKLEEMNEHLELLVERRTQELVQTSKMASLGEMAGSIAHEINNPLAIILGQIFEARKRQETNALDPAALSRILTNIQETSLRIEKIVKGLKFFAREGSFDERVDVSFLTVVEETVALCQNKLNVQNISLELRIPENVRILCHPVGISHVLLNLISNSMDALESVSDKRIVISGEETRDSVLIRVTDSGCGIAPEIREKIIQPFFTTKPVGKGTGLGLSIVKGIIEQHKGSLCLDTNNPQTTFVITFPRK